MAPKRPADGQLSGAARKKARMREQRTISVQSTAPERSNSNPASSGALPPAFQVDKFVQARSFEITAMKVALKSSKEAAAQRAFQSLPRHLRRRAASHNVRRLPKRLRQKAISETPEGAAKPKKRSVNLLAKKKRTVAARTFSKTQVWTRRQRHKIWLETHIWHAKRMHMVDVWGHRLAVKPTQKSFRSSYRASRHGALLHDASYYQYLELSCWNRQTVAEWLERVCDPTAPLPSLPRYANGSRECSTTIYEDASRFPLGQIGPATILWEPTGADGARVWLRLHPSICVDVYRAFRRHHKDFSGSHSLTMKRFDKSFCTFELTGKQSIRILKGVLDPVKASMDSTKASAWRALDAERGPSLISPGTVIGLDVHDPRLSFPPRFSRTSGSNSDKPKTSSLVTPSPELARSDRLWDDKVRESLKAPRFKKRDLDERRSTRNLVPGTRLAPTAQDDRVPVLISTGSSSSSSSSSSSTVTLVVPAGWGMAFWESLSYGNVARPAGLAQRAQVDFENPAASGSSCTGGVSFPRDHVFTRAYDEFEKARKLETEGYWSRKPPSKRSNYRKLGSASPFEADLETIVRDWAAAKDEHGEEECCWTASNSLPFALVSVLRGDQLPPLDATSQSERGDSKTPGWLRRSYEQAQRIVSVWRDEQGPKQDRSLLNGVVLVSIKPVSRGAPEELGYVYFIDDDDDKDEEAKALTGNQAQKVMGRITTGSYSLTRGRGQGIAAVSLVAWLRMAERELKKDDENSKRRGMRAVFRNKDSTERRLCTLEMIPLLHA